MLRPHKNDGGRKIVKKVTEWKPNFRKARGRPKGGTSIRGHKKAKNPQLEREDPTLEVMEENHKRGKDEQGIMI